MGSVAVKVVLETAQDMVLTEFSSSRLDWFAAGVRSEVVSTLLLVILSVFCTGPVVIFKLVTVEAAEDSGGLEVLPFTCKVIMGLPSTLVTVGAVVQTLRLLTSLGGSLRCGTVVAGADDKFCPSPSAGEKQRKAKIAGILATHALTCDGQMPSSKGR